MSSCQQAQSAEPMLTLHENAFYAFFRPYRHPQSSCDIWGGNGLETFGADLELVKSLPVTNVWTVVDGDGGDQWILTGIHTVNRICYLITEVAHDWKEIEFRIPRRGYSLTRIGLLRQVNKLKSLRGQDSLCAFPSANRCTIRVLTPRLGLLFESATEVVYSTASNRFFRYTNPVYGNNILR